MADKENTAEEGKKTPDEEDPFSSFESSEYEDGEEVGASASAQPEEPPEGGEGDDDEGSGDDGGVPGDDDEDSGDDDGDSGDDDGRSKKKGKQTAQERINEVTRLRREAERRAEAAEAELQRLKHQPPPPPDDAKGGDGEAEEGAAEAKEGEPPDPDDFDYGELDPRYIRSLASYEARQEFQKLREKEEETRAEEAARKAQEEARERFEEQVAKGSKKHEDFYEKVIIGAEKGEWALSEHLGQLLANSDVGDDIAYHLASHPEEAAQVYRQTPLEQARYFGKMEAKFTAGSSAATGEEAGKTTETRTPKAPPPVKPARGSDGKFSPSASTDDFSAFEAHANSQ